MKDLKKFIDFIVEIESFKKTFRYSTCPDYVKDSSAEHSWKVAFIAIFLAEEVKNLDAYHALQICLVHDLAESITGDIDAYRIVSGEITREQKSEDEEKAMLAISNKVPDIGLRIYNLWKEYEEQKTPEANFAKVLDKIESLVHLLSVGYIAQTDNKEAELTATYADNAVEKFPQLRPVLDIIKERLKDEFAKQGFEWKKHYDLGEKEA